ncbi:hypothetical protein GCM10009841_28570 [Microlunatus panaciterrae]|uniref:Four helix bundle sensory module for signal transduction n=1 Tax=Microlunatus panaciterrae TaxID=400768 RepID=A0ABS2RG59_9ACTN|nr:hypothetical protein [Microlunatus panaciterrae]MBM7797517.1 hypothetical protein [Microlunatus panaciterrae]
MSSSQPAAAPPPPTPAAAPAAATSTSAPVTARPAAETAPAAAGPAKRRASTPQRLSLLAAMLIALSLLFAALSAFTFGNTANGLNRARDNTDQLIRVQKIQTNLLEADATATNAFLVGGLEPPAQRATYDRALSQTSALIAEAAEAQPADADALAALNDEVVGYAASMAQARANNRQGFPVGAQYLRNASAELRSTALPILDNLVVANTERAADEMSPGLGYLFILSGLLALGGLLFTQYWVARRFRRTFNLGLLAATVLVLATLIAGSVALNGLGQRLDAIQQGSFSDVRDAASARIEANNAKSNESLTLIARGSGAAFEKAWATAAAQVDSRLAALPSSGQDLQPLWQSYRTTHQQLRKLDDGGSWDAAVQVATGTGAKSSNATFGSFNSAVAEFLASASSDTSAALGRPLVGLWLGAVLAALAALAAGWLSWVGIGTRLKEYR